MGAPVVISIIADARNAIRGFRDTAGAAQTAGSKIKGAAGAMTGPAIAGLGAVGAVAFKAAQDASELGDAIDANRIIFGKASADIEKFGSSAAKNFGLSKQAVIDASNAMGTFGAAAGLTGRDLSKFTTDLVGRAGDVASMFGGTAQEATEAFGAALRGEFEGVRKYGVLIDDAAIKATAMTTGMVKASGNIDQIRAAQVGATAAQQAYNEALKKYGPTSIQTQKAQVGLTAAQGKLKKATDGTVPTLTAQQKTLAIQRTLLGQTTIAQGNYGDTAGSAKNQQQSLSASTANTTAEMGKNLLPALSKVTSALSGFVDFASKNSGAVKVIGGVIAGLAVAVIAVNAAFKVAAAGQAIWTAATKLGAVWTAVSTAATAAWNAVLALNPIGIIVIAIIALVAGLVLLYKNSETARKIMDAAWKGIKTAAVAVFNFLAGFFKTVFAGIVAAFRWVVAQAKSIWAGLQTIAAVAAAIFGRVRAVVSAVVGWIVGQFRAAVNNVKAVWAGLTAVVGIILGIRGRIIDAFLSIVRSVRGVGADIVQGLKDGITGAWGRVTSAVQGLVNKIPKAIRDMLHIGSPSKVTMKLGGQIVDGLTKGIRDEIPQVRRQIRAVGAVVETTFAATAAPTAQFTADVTAAGGIGATAGGGNVYNITVNVPPSADPVAVGRAIERTLRAYEAGTGRAVLMPI